MSTQFSVAKISAARFSSIVFCVCVTALVVGCAPKTEAPVSAAAAFDNNSDRPGGTYKELTLEAEDAAACLAACEADPKCKSWSLLKGSVPLCRLKAERVARLADTCCVSGVRRVTENETATLSRSEIRKQHRALNSEKDALLEALAKEEAQFNSKKQAELKSFDDRGAAAIADAKTKKQAIAAEVEALKAAAGSLNEELAALDKATADEAAVYEKRLAEVAGQRKALVQKIESSQKTLAAKGEGLGKALDTLDTEAKSERLQVASEQEKAVAEFAGRESSFASRREEIVAEHEREAQQLLAALRGLDEGQSPESAPVLEAEKSFVELNTDRPGGDYQTLVLESASPRACMTSCRADRKCRAWTYVKPGVLGSQARCFLKKATPEKEASDCCISGLRVDEGAARATDS